MAYSAGDKALVVAAVESYGETIALRMLADNLDLHPGRASLQRWARDGEVEATEEARDFWSTLERGRKARLQAEIEPRIYATLEAYDRAIAEDKALAAQQLATATGILTDKLIPPVRAGGGPLIGNANEVQMIVVAPAAIDPATLPVVDGETEDGFATSSQAR